MTDIWLTYDWYMTDIWLIKNWHITDMIYDWYMTDIWLTYDWYMADIWLMLLLWPLAVTPEITHFGAYHRPLDGNFELQQELFVMMLHYIQPTFWDYFAFMPVYRDFWFCNLWQVIECQRDFLGQLWQFLTNLTMLTILNFFLSFLMFWFFYLFYYFYFFTFLTILTFLDNLWQFYNVNNDNDNPRDLWPLRHWLQFWQLRT